MALFLLGAAGKLLGGAATKGAAKKAIVGKGKDIVKDKAKGKSGLRNDPKQNALGSDLSKGTGLNIPTKPKK